MSDKVEQRVPRQCCLSASQYSIGNNRRTVMHGF